MSNPTQQQSFFCKFHTTSTIRCGLLTIRLHNGLIIIKIKKNYRRVCYGLGRMNIGDAVKYQHSPGLFRPHGYAIHWKDTFMRMSVLSSLSGKMGQVSHHKDNNDKNNQQPDDVTGSDRFFSSIFVKIKTPLVGFVTLIPTNRKTTGTSIPFHRYTSLAMPSQRPDDRFAS